MPWLERISHYGAQAVQHAHACNADDMLAQKNPIISSLDVTVPCNRHAQHTVMYCNTTLALQVRELQTALEAKRAACDRQERQLQLSANQRQRQHNVEEQYNEAQRRLRSAETTIQDLQANVQVS